MGQGDFASSMRGICAAGCAVRRYRIDEARAPHVVSVPARKVSIFAHAKQRGQIALSLGAAYKRNERFGRELMGQVNQLEIQFAQALDRLREAIATRAPSGEGPEAEQLRRRVAALENDKAKLLEELVSIRAKRDKDVAALDQLISQLKPLIEET
jgi:hypothetical protein